MPTLANKNYPYPIITREQSFSSYNGINYSFSFEKETDENNLILKNVKLETNSNTLIDLLNQGKVKAIISVSCSKTYYKYTEEIGLMPRTIKLNLYNLKDKVEISAYVFANENLNQFSSSECLDEYQGYNFDIEKYCLFAIDDGYKLPVEYDDYNDKKVSSIFRVSEIEKDVDRLIKIYPENDYIIIAIPKEECKSYRSLKDNEDFAAIFLSILGCPALTNCLTELQKERKTVEEIIEQYAWFKTIIKAYKNLNGVDLDDNLFEQLNCFEFSQQVLGNCNVSSLSSMLTSFKNLSKNNSEDEEEAEEE